MSAGFRRWPKFNVRYVSFASILECLPHWLEGIVSKRTDAPYRSDASIASFRYAKHPCQFLYFAPRIDLKNFWPRHTTTLVSGAEYQNQHCIDACWEVNAQAMLRPVFPSIKCDTVPRAG